MESPPGSSRRALRAPNSLGRGTKSAGELRRHHRHAPRLGVPLKLADKRRPLLLEVEIVDMAEPARQRVEVHDARPPDRADRLALLPGEPDFLLHDAAFERFGRDDEDEVLEVLRPQGVLDLAPPVLPALERGEVLPEGEVVLFEAGAEIARKVGAVLARIGDEGPARRLANHDDFPMCRGQSSSDQRACNAAKAAAAVPSSRGGRRPTWRSRGRRASDVPLDRHGASRLAMTAIGCGPSIQDLQPMQQDRV